MTIGGSSNPSQLQRARQRDRLHTLLGTMEHARNGAICFKLSRRRVRPMTNAEHLLQQAIKAERLARAVNDTLTIERLRAYAADCRKKAAGQSECAAA
jgi:hypothetical protein